MMCCYFISIPVWKSREAYEPCKAMALDIKMQSMGCEYLVSYY